MKYINLPPTPELYEQNLLESAFPDEQITENPFYKNLIRWVVNERSPLLYDQGHTDEYTNLSINFNWLLMRDYSETKLGPPDTIKTMYSLHEFTHMTHWLPTRLDELTPGQYAEEFTSSEYRASNETEILIHYRIPELRKFVFKGMKIGADLLKEKNIPQPTSAEMSKARALLIETDTFDKLIPQEYADVLEKYKEYGNNRPWARERFEKIKPFFTDSSLPIGSGLMDDEYEQTIESYDKPLLSQEEYEKNMIRNVRFGFAMCGLAIPEIGSFKQARELVKSLEGQHAIVQED